MTAIQDAPTKVISPSKLSHVVFRTRPENAAKMAEFWEFFVGGKKVFQSDLLTLIAYDDEHHRIAIVPIPVVGPKVKLTSGLDVYSVHPLPQQHSFLCLG